ncbi:GNAT family N-acetyltransferase [Geminicoccaceae bacterium 1502E]|nr:GNAT family N-acetyltransferase [Geminicoccaceae bacterium 1502E]
MDQRVEIVTPGETHKEGWRHLYDGYATFYRREMTDTIAGAVWGWLQDPAHELEGALALQGGVPVGLAHYRRMPSPLRGADIGFLDDLFVDPSARGGNVGELLIDHVAKVARERGWGVVRWITADDNYRARSLYDRLAKKTSWNLYELTP